MDEIKVVEILANDVSNESKEREADPAGGPEEARPLKQFASVTAGGGDGIAIW
jgi:hypothetical protein